MSSVPSGSYPLSLVSAFVVIPISVSRKGKLRVGTPQRFDDPEEAIGAANGLKTNGAGVIILAEEGEATASPTGLRLVAHFGKVPQEILHLPILLPV